LENNNIGCYKHFAPGGANLICAWLSSDHRGRKLPRSYSLNF